MTELTTETIQNYAPHTNEPVLISTETVELSPEEQAARAVEQAIKAAEQAVLDAADAVESAGDMTELMAALKTKSAAETELMRVRGQLPPE